MATDAARTAELTSVYCRVLYIIQWYQLHCFAEKVKEREDHIRETWVRNMEARITQEQLQKCYRAEGVNNLENCRQLALKYAQMLKDNRVRFYFVFVFVLPAKPRCRYKATNT